MAAKLKREGKGNQMGKSPALDFSTRLFRALALSVILFASPSLHAEALDLCAIDFYARNGFSVEDARSLPSQGDSIWVRVAGHPRTRPIVIRDLGLGIHGEKTGTYLFSPRAPEEEFTLVADLGPGSKIRGIEDPALYFALIGQKWQVYLNGGLLASDLGEGVSSLLPVDRSRRGAIVGLDKSLLAEEANILGIRIIGNPKDWRTGLYMGGPYLLDSRARLEARKDETLDLLFVGIYLFVGLYHLILFALRPRERANAWYGAGALALALWAFSKTFSVLGIIPNFDDIKGLEYLSLFAIVPAFVGYFDCLALGRTRVLTRSFAAFFAMLFLLSEFWSRELMYYAWLATVLVPLLSCVIGDFILPLARSMREDRAKAYSWRKALIHCLIGTDVGKLTIAILVLLSCFAWDTERIFVNLTSNASVYGVFILVLVSSYIQAKRNAEIHREAEGLNAELGEKVAELGALIARSDGSLRIGGDLLAASEDSKARAREIKDDLLRLEVEAKDLQARAKQSEFANGGIIKHARDMLETLRGQNLVLGEAVGAVKNLSGAIGGIAGIAKARRGAIDSVIVALGARRNDLGKVMEAMKGVEAESAKVLQVSAVIIGVAERTDLLALNAAIEAARAGSSGKGFAVIAGEVRKLSDESKKSSEDINRTLTGNRQAITAIAASIQDFAQGLEATMGEIRSTLGAVGEIIDGLEGMERETGSLSEKTAKMAEATALADESARGVAIKVEEGAVGVAGISGFSAELNSSVEHIMGRFSSIEDNLTEVARIGERNIASMAELGEGLAKIIEA